MESGFLGHEALEALSLDDTSVVAPKNLQFYKHQPLESDSHIRLLSFSIPSRDPEFQSWDLRTEEYTPISLDEVDFDIIHVDLGTEPQYQALSYVWGDNASTTEIRLKGERKIDITTSLCDALTQVIGLKAKLPLWIDQVCINQHDFEERSRQVSMMGTIYISAEHTIVWLGEEKEDYTPHLMRLIYAYRKKSRRDHTWDWCKAVMKDNVELKFDPEKPTVKAKRGRALQEVLNRPWFQRAWVFQEAVLSKAVIMMVGRHEFYLWELYLLVEHFLSLEYAIDGYRNSIGKTTTGYEPLNSMNELRQHWLRKKEPRKFLPFVCRASGYWKATERRDMFYAFLGLLNKPGLFAPLGYKIYPDYSAPLRDVYISLTRTIINGSLNLDILSKAIGDEPVLEPKHMRISEPLPSWVPDWAISTPLVMALHNSANNSFDACKGYPYRQISSSEEILLVRGKIVTEINCEVNHQFERHYFMDADRGWLDLDRHCDEIVSFVVPGTTHNITRDRVLKTLLADGALVWPSRIVSPEKPSMLSDSKITDLLHAYDMWPRIAGGDTSIPNLEKVKNDLRYLQQQSLIVQRKRLAGCADGRLALVPRACMLKHDCKIAILHGSRVPIVMIEKREGTNEWQVIGQCYLEDYMYGDWVDWKEEDGDVFKIV